MPKKLPKYLSASKFHIQHICVPTRLAVIIRLVNYTGVGFFKIDFNAYIDLRQINSIVREILFILGQKGIESW